MASERFSKLKEFLSLNKSESELVLRYLFSPSKFYRVFFIPKRKGGLRKITVPYPSLGAIQNKILSKLISLNIPIHENSFAYVKNKNFIMHTAKHLKNDELLQLDIVDFFHNTTREKIKLVLSNYIDELIINFIIRLCTYNGCLPQGCCTSPYLSNIVMFYIDNKLYEYSIENNLNYSRYADDIAFSGKKVNLNNVLAFVDSILKDNDYFINKSKTKYSVLGERKIITGISISNKIMKVPRKFKRKLRNDIYKLETTGASIPNECDFLIFEKTLGKLNYFLQIEPDNVYAIEKRDVILQLYKKFSANKNIQSIENIDNYSILLDDSYK